MPTTGLLTLRRLSSIITESLDTIEQVYAHAEMPLPSLDAPFDPTDPAEAVRQDPVVMTAILNIIAATSQMSATLCNPAAAVVNTSMAFHISSCLRAASELDVADILREVGSEGLHVKDIAAPSNADPGLLARVLRLLATHNIFREVTPDVFANNRLSSALDSKAKPPGVFLERREERLIGTSGVAAAVEFFSDDIFKSSAWLTDTMLEPKDGVLPFNKAFGTEEPVFVYMQRQENAYRRLRLGIGMQGMRQTSYSQAWPCWFDWGALSAGSVLADIGGGHGHLAMSIAQKHPNLRVVIQDFERTLDGAEILWKNNFPTHIESGMVEFQAHDFFDPQPLKNAAVFMLRFILHDWSDTRCVEILQNLRDAAQPSTQLVIIERIIPSAASAPGLEVENVPGAQRPSAPPPLLPNWGVGMAAFYLYDFDVHTILGGVERTLGGFSDILSKAHWKLDRVYHCVGSELSHIVGVPA
ncbi:O-methyltransferase [Mycena rebaudengoi]|nr:O-methyltransferase [Mycena rebaudengoi]